MRGDILNTLSKASLWLADRLIDVGEWLSRKAHEFWSLK